MAEHIKVVNGHVIKSLSREEINKELLAKGDWSIDYYVPGRTFEHLFITINRKRYRFNFLEQVEKVCNTYDKNTLKAMSQEEIEDAIRTCLFDNSMIS